uniref:Protein-glucosylgalactosylhydroxylysine glucosidase n=1 Tax=Culex pipiens TaxID=7175 RepID=A0A8D8GXX5_CULPI
MRPVIAVTVAVTVTLLAATGYANVANFLFMDTKLPAQAVRPTLANGNLGFVVYGDAVHMNGVYNGLKGLSHRARIPNFANIQLPVCADSNPNPTGCTYQLDMKTGMFRTVFEDPQGYFRVVHDVYPHRYLDKMIVNKFRIQRLNAPSVIQVPIQRYTSGVSADVLFNADTSVYIDGVQYSIKCGITTEVEDSRYQTFGHSVCIAYPDIPTELSLTMDKTAEEFFFYTAFGRTESEVQNEIRGKSLGELSHTTMMNQIWSMYGITVEGNNDLDKVLKASAFYLSSSLPIPRPHQPSSYPFYGLSPSGLGRGGIELSEYQGHSFWDTETWMFPPILLIDPDNARRILHYRTVVQKAAADRAAANEFEGWQFPWESAFTGTETTPECCPEVVEYQHHITADIAYAARMYFYATHDVDWMRTEGCKLAYETAKFWKSRAEYNKETDLYEIHRVMGPDEDTHNVTNNAFTNVVAAHNLLFGEFAGCLCSGAVGASEAERRTMAEIGRGMTLPYDKEQDYIPQYEGYVQGTAIKQADTILLGYPLEYPMNGSTKANNLDIYSKVTRTNGPAMTWAMHTIGHLDLDQIEEARAMFTKSYQQYLRAPYNVWSENGDGTDGAGNFITGAGGFLQSVINGYAGVRLRNGELVISKPRLLPGTTRLYIPAINYMGATFYLDIQMTRMLIGVKTPSKVVLIVDGAEKLGCESCFYSFTEQVVIRPAAAPELNGCKLQDTIIGVKIADQNTGGSAQRFYSPVALISSILLALVAKYIQ